MMFQSDPITVSVSSHAATAVLAVLAREAVAYFRRKPENGNGRLGQQPAVSWENKFDRLSDRIDAMSAQLSSDIRGLRDDLKPTVTGMQILIDRVPRGKGAGA